MAEVVGNLAYKLTVENGQFTSGMQQAGQQITRLKSDAQSGGGTIERAFQGVGDSAKTALSALQSGGGGGASRIIGGLVGDVAGLGKTLVGLAGPWGVAALAVAGGFTLILNEASKVQDKLNDINKLAKVLGETGENTQVLQRVFESAGIDAAGSQQILLRFFDRLGDLRRSLRDGGTGGETGNALREIGLDPRQIAELNPEAAIEQIVTALSQMDNAYDRAANSQALFGRSFIEVEPIVRRGARAFEEARAAVDRAGASRGLLQFAAATKDIQRNLERDLPGGLFARIGQAWDTYGALISRMSADAQRGFRVGVLNVSEAIGVISPEENRARQTILAGGGRAPQVQLATIDREAERLRLRTEAADKAAEKLLGDWGATAATIGASSREAAIYKAECDGASEAVLRQLRSQDLVLRRLEEERKLREDMLNLSYQAWTAQESFLFAIDQFNQASGAGLISQEARLGSLVATFRNLERAIGAMNSQTLAVNGVAADSVEAARIWADVRTRAANGGNDVQARVLQVLEAARQLHEQQLAEMQAIADALARNPGLGIAPIRE